VTIRLDDRRRAALEAVLPAIAAFKQEFGRDISPDFIAELYAARELDLQLVDGSCAPGFDATDSNGKRYQIKCRDAGTRQVDFNNFEFDYLVLVNLDGAYGLAGIWRVPVDAVRRLTIFRAKFRKHQALQVRLKAAAQ